ncbi:MAG: glycoside hydrolase [Candidatus Omnitrophica bacterium]|nr:glycoside hydrolase [Candidatus Omnitrophota bacterium]
MIYLAFILHMHQPYYKNLLTGEAELPWARLHGIKDYLDMVLLLDEFPQIRQTFNVVPSLLEQIEEYACGNLSDKYLRLSYKNVSQLTSDEKYFIREHFFSADLNRIVGVHPRYYHLFLHKHSDYEFSDQDFLDLQVWFNLAWFDPRFRQDIPELRALVKKSRYFTEEEKKLVLDKQSEILKKILPTYKQYQQEGRIELSLTPYFHPILPLLFSSFAGRDANAHITLPKTVFSHPQDAIWHVQAAVDYYREKFGMEPRGMWPSEQAVSKDILPILTKAKLNWIVTDETILWKTCPKVKRDGRVLYRPYTLKIKDAELNVVFRDRFLSDLIGFEYQNWRTKDAVDNFMHHILKIKEYFGNNDCLLTIALDGENCWEYYRNDGRDFLKLLYERISEASYLETVTISEYLKKHPPKHHLPDLATGSWIFGDLNKWMGHPAKNRAWELLTEARNLLTQEQLSDERIMKQIHILEGSDWFWWLGDKHRHFDDLFRLHLKNLYQMIGKKPSVDLDIPIDI